MHARDALALGLLAACAVALIAGVVQKQNKTSPQPAPASKVKVRREEPALQFDPEEPYDEAPAKAQPSKPDRPPPKTYSTRMRARINPNSASQYVLANRLGDAYARRVVAGRPFRSVDDIYALAETEDEALAAKQWLFIPLPKP